ncbi:MAG: transcription-repair coupling factor, partial [Planctomycetaceae bacterium]
VKAALQRGESGSIDGAWGSSCALVGAALAKSSPRPFVVILPQISDVDEFAADMAGFLDSIPLIFPAWESLPKEHVASDVVFGARLRVLGALQSPAPGTVIVTSIEALLQTVPSRAERAGSTRTLKIGDEIDSQELLRWLVDRGFERVPAVEVPGEFSMHGGIVDVFAPDAEDPVRFELFGDEIESIRRFDASTQRKLEDLREISLTLVAVPMNPEVGDEEIDKAERTRRPPEMSASESLLDSLPAESWIALVEMPEIVEGGRQYLGRLDDTTGLFSVEAVLAHATTFPTVTLSALSADSMETSCHLRIESIERFARPRAEAIAELATVVERDEQILIACHNDGERQRLAELLTEQGESLARKVELCIGSVARGFRFVREGLVVLSDHEIFGRVDVRRDTGRRKRPESRAIDSFLELRERDLIVHLVHGIGRFLGMELLRKEGQVEEHLTLEFRDKVRLYVPVSLIHLVQKYVGASKAAPTLSVVGGTAWSKKKQRVAEAVMDLASDMIQLQAQRELRPGIAHPPDSHLQQEFEASFPYTETKDQLDAIADVKDDMQKSRPMDRLICGDVGYGKTEVAMRGAFKAVDAGKQAAVLVPTTVLAEQHYRTFRERMAEYPVNIEVLSRFRTKGEQKRILAGLESGAVDIVIGTHRLVQKDIKFKDLGLLVIDEEQRFGVEAKEQLKQLRLEVDVLTMSATPIPRTLHMSILGIRDISNLLTAPQDRQAIETRISRFDPELIRSAIVRELNRGGQVYFVHNRVHNIKMIAERLQRIVPEATIGIAHGQMSEHELEDAMINFVQGRLDILVATTIIESGLDIPNANTIFIHQADRYGLAEMHQLRGRVGRYKHRAYCCLLLEEGKTLSPVSARRLKAIEEFSELGAGFKIAMRDLEIRGAGNILGTEQSGHISSVGYELYCQLLENAVRTLKKEPLREHPHVAVDLPVSAYLANSYVPSGRQKIEMYRRFSAIATFQELEQVRGELRDRFGPVPIEAERMLALKELQLLAREWQIHDIHLEEKFAVLKYRNMRRINELGKLRGSRFRIVDTQNAYWLLSDGVREGDELVAELKSVLQLS